MMNSDKEFRNNGAIGALLDEYEKAINEIILLIKGITAEELVVVVDKVTEDADCKSIQTILTHTVRAGYGYIVAIRKHLGEELESVAGRKLLNSEKEYAFALIQMFKYNEKLFDDYPDLVLEEYKQDKKILVRSGQHYDVEQLLEHAIVHILRHRRQIERFLVSVRG